MNHGSHAAYTCASSGRPRWFRVATSYVTQSHIQMCMPLVCKYLDQYRVYVQNVLDAIGRQRRVAHVLNTCQSGGNNRRTSHTHTYIHTRGTSMTYVLVEPRVHMAAALSVKWTERQVKSIELVSVIVHLWIVIFMPAISE